MADKRCFSCGLLTPPGAVACTCDRSVDVPVWIDTHSAIQYAGHRPVSHRKSRHSTIYLYAGLLFLVLALVQITCILGFHVVLYNQNLILVPKERLTFRNTFLHIPPISRVDATSVAPSAQSQDAVLAYLHQQLRTRLIYPRPCRTVNEGYCMRHRVRGALLNSFVH